jgi:hypothetical protein
MRFLPENRLFGLPSATRHPGNCDFLNHTCPSGVHPQGIRKEQAVTDLLLADYKSNEFLVQEDSSAKQRNMSELIHGSAVLTA